MQRAYWQVLLGRKTRAAISSEASSLCRRRRRRAVPCRASRIIFIENDNSKTVNRKRKIEHDREGNGKRRSPTREQPVIFFPLFLIMLEKEA
jgi:hypothetical protein